jgi:hypothetical protein
MQLIVRPFEQKTFIADISDLVSHERALDSPHFKFLAKYLEQLKTRSILVEKEYTDGGYLIDYANYYARCHEAYARTTTRLHFFGIAANEVRSAFDAITGERRSEALQQGHKTLQEAYLGFVVLKPLPTTIMGRTCLKTYGEDDEEFKRKRCFPILRAYDVHLYGANLSVRSIAFQEQDSEVAVCATTAIWHSMHAMPTKFTIQEIPSPYEITNLGSATYIRRNLGEVTRRFPTSGLNLEQIEAYFRSHRLECIVAGMTPESIANDKLKNAVAAYVRAGLPIVIVGNLFVANGDSEHPSSYTHVGMHAITTLGFAHEPAFKEGDWSTRIVRLFAHDDNVGPFTSYHFETCEKGKFLEQVDDASSIDKSFFERVTHYLWNQSGMKGSGFTHRKLVPYYYLVPIDPKIRLPYETIYPFQSLLVDIWKKRGHQSYSSGTSLPKLSASVRLFNAAEYQRYLVESTTIHHENLKRILAYPGPRLLWLVSFSMKTNNGNESKLIDVVFDATALQQSGGLLMLIMHETKESETFMSVMSTEVQRWKRVSTETTGKKKDMLTTLYQQAHVRPIWDEFVIQLEAPSRSPRVP